MPSTAAPTEEDPEEAGNIPTIPPVDPTQPGGDPAPVESYGPGLLPQPTPVPYDPEEPMLPPGL